MYKDDYEDIMIYSYDELLKIITNNLSKPKDIHDISLEDFCFSQMEEGDFVEINYDSYNYEIFRKNDIRKNKLKSIEKFK